MNRETYRPQLIKESPQVDGVEKQIFAAYMEANENWPQKPFMIATNLIDAAFQTGSTFTELVSAVPNSNQLTKIRKSIASLHHRLGVVPRQSIMEDSYLLSFWKDGVNKNVQYLLGGYVDHFDGQSSLLQSPLQVATRVDNFLASFLEQSIILEGYFAHGAAVARTPEAQVLSQGYIEQVAAFHQMGLTASEQDYLQQKKIGKMIETYIYQQSDEKVNKALTYMHSLIY